MSGSVTRATSMVESAYMSPHPVSVFPLMVTLSRPGRTASPLSSTMLVLPSAVRA